jgi:hypothetical protein
MRPSAPETSKPVVAERRASGRSPRPIAIETTVPMPTIMPKLRANGKNITFDISATAARHSSRCAIET